MVQPASEIVEVRGKRHRGLEPEEIGFAARLASEFGKIVLAPIDRPEHVTHMTDADREDGVDDDAGALGLFNRGLDIGVPRARAAKAVDAVRDHQNLVTKGTLRPTLDQVLNGQVRAGEGTHGTHRQAQSLGRLCVVAREVLHRVDRSIVHVTDSDQRTGGLRHDELTDIL